MDGKRLYLCLIGIVWYAVVAAQGAGSDSVSPSAFGPAESIWNAIAGSNSNLSTILRDVLERNPEVASAKAKAAAMERRPDQVKALPDPMAVFTAYLNSPETRVGPQQFMAGISQRFPWFGKLHLNQQVALLEAAAAASEVEARKLSALSDARQLYREIAFQDKYADLTRIDRDLLIHYETVAQARYASGVGLHQAVIKIQTEITRDEARLLNIEAQRAKLLSSLNALRDMPAATPVDPDGWLVESDQTLDLDQLRQIAWQSRPEMSVADSRIQAGESRILSSQKEYSPDFTVGLSYVFVGERNDPAGIMTPPPDNGKDVLGVNFGFNIPIHRKKLKAGVDEATRLVEMARENRRHLITSIESDLGDLTQRITLLRNQIRLFDDVILIQAEESLRSAEAAYAAGTLTALELLDAERQLLETRVAAARSKTDYAVAIIRLERTIAAPLAGVPGGQS